MRSAREPGGGTAAPAPAATTRRRKLVFAAVAVVLLLGLVEAAARVVEIWRPPQAVDVGAGFLPMSRVFEPSPDDPATLRTAQAKQVSFRKQSFPARKPLGTLRVVGLGGSSVNYADEDFALLVRHLLSKLAPAYQHAEFINAGGAAYGSARLRIVAEEILQYEPDVVVLYEAHNEFEEVEQLHLASVETAGVQRFLSHVAMARLLRDLLAERELERLRREHEARRKQADELPDQARAWHYEFTAKDVDERMAALRDNYGAIVDACRAKGVTIVLGTVPSNLVRPALQYQDFQAYQAVWNLRDAGRYDEAHALGRKLLAGIAARHQSSDRENAVLRRLAEDKGVPLADVEAAVIAAEPHHIPGETLFQDHCHLNEKGRPILTATFEEAVLRELRAKLTRAPLMPKDGR